MNLCSKICGSIMLVLLAVCIAVPVACLNTEPRSFSEADNRYCAEWPEGEDLTFTEWASGVDSYLSDRIGFRKEAMGSYMEVNNEAFGVLDHPDYDYGKDGHLFHAFDFYVADDEYVELYANYIVQMAEYCAQRGVPFLYVNSPSKEFVYSEYYADNVPMRKDVFDIIQPILDEAGVDYIDLTDVLIEAKEAGHQVYNVFYDPGHWNTEGAFIGSNAILAKLADMGVDVEQAKMSDYNTEKVFIQYQVASVFPINQYFDRYVHKENGTQATELPDYEADLEVSPYADYRFIYENDSVDNDTNLLMFQGSYFNSQGTSLYHQFARANLVHDYLNVMDISYYMDVFQPNVVVFECADYAVRDGYYNVWDLTYADLPPVFEDTYDRSWFYHLYMPNLTIIYPEDATIANLSIECNTSYIQYAYVEMNDTVYECLVRDEDIHWGVDAAYLEESQEAQVYLVCTDGSLQTYTVTVEAGIVEEEEAEEVEGTEETDDEGSAEEAEE